MHTSKPVAAAAVFGILSLVGGAAGQPFTLTSPNGGEFWIAGEPQLISWTPAAPCDRVRLTLLAAGEPYLFIAEVQPYIPYEYEWTCAFIGNGDEWQVQAECIDYYNQIIAVDASDDYFEIVGSPPRPSFTLTAPAAGDAWPAGSTQTVRWTCQDPHGHAALWLYRNGQRAAFLGQKAADAGELTWDIDPYTPAGEYTVRLQWVEPCGPPVEAWSPSFSITGGWAAPSFALTSPNGGEVWPGDTTQTITWEGAGAGEVEIWLGGWIRGAEWIGSAPLEQGAFEWAVPANVWNSADARVTLRWTGGGQVIEDTSDAPFTLGPSFTPTLTPTGPAENEMWIAGTTQLITWTCDAISGEVDVDVQSTDLTLHVGRAPVTAGGIAWDICPGLPDGPYNVRLSIASCGLAVVGPQFTITGSTPPTLVLTSPAGGQTLTAGLPLPITWTATNLAGLLDIYVPNDGQFHPGHAVVPVEAGEYLWPVPGTLAAGEYPRLTIVAYDCGPVLKATAYDVVVAAGATMPGDIDAGGDVDLHDFLVLQIAYTGRGPTWLNPPGAFFDVEPDGDVDSDDFAQLAGGWTGPAMPAPAMGGRTGGVR